MITLAEPKSDLNKECVTNIRIFISEIFSEYMRRHDLIYEDIYTDSRRHKYNFFRALIILELRKRKVNFVKIGEVLKRDHSSVVYASQKYNKTIRRYDTKWREVYNEWISIKENVNCKS